MTQRENNEKLLFCSVEDLRLSVAAVNCLHKAMIYTVEELLRYTEEELYLLRGMNKHTLKDIVWKLHQLGLSLPGDSCLCCVTPVGEEFLQVSIEELHLSARTTCTLLGAGIHKVEKLTSLTQEELIGIRGIGRVKRGVRNAVCKGVFSCTFD